MLGVRGSSLKPSPGSLEALSEKLEPNAAKVAARPLCGRLCTPGYAGAEAEDSRYCRPKASHLLTKCMEVPVARRQKTVPPGAVFGVLSTAP
jgi:hypothetical protein